ncbi:hypothetical protein HanIR_Chr07g0300501 [Helianthus annuus]|nr:hypothetical protein HanIR_Chr07g0300501 [Helianthus annuus]
MSSFWDVNYFFGQYSNQSWVPETDFEESGVPDSNEEEVVFDIHFDQNKQLLDLNEPPHPPVDEPYYPLQRDYPNGGGGYDRKNVTMYPDDEGYGGVPPNTPSYDDEHPPNQGNLYQTNKVSHSFSYVRLSYTYVFS